MTFSGILYHDCFIKASHDTVGWEGQKQEIYLAGKRKGGPMSKSAKMKPMQIGCLGDRVQPSQTYLVVMFHSHTESIEHDDTHDEVRNLRTLWKPLTKHPESCVEGRSFADIVLITYPKVKHRIWDGRTLFFFFAVGGICCLDTCIALSSRRCCHLRACLRRSCNARI